MGYYLAYVESYDWPPSSQELLVHGTAIYSNELMSGVPCKATKRLSRVCYDKLIYTPISIDKLTMIRPTDFMCRLQTIQRVLR